MWASLFCFSISKRTPLLHLYKEVTSNRLGLVLLWPGLGQCPTLSIHDL